MTTTPGAATRARPLAVVGLFVLETLATGAATFKQLLRATGAGQGPLAGILSALRQDGYLHQHLDTFSLTGHGRKLVEAEHLRDEQKTKRRARPARRSHTSNITASVFKKGNISDEQLPGKDRAPRQAA
jgi:DNA-binding IclR family transcriptional regulator